MVRTGPYEFKRGSSDRARSAAANPNPRVRKSMCLNQGARTMAVRGNSDGDEDSASGSVTSKVNPTGSNESGSVASRRKPVVARSREGSVRDGEGDGGDDVSDKSEEAEVGDNPENETTAASSSLAASSVTAARLFSGADYSSIAGGSSSHIPLSKLIHVPSDGDEEAAEAARLKETLDSMEARRDEVMLEHDDAMEESVREEKEGVEICSYSSCSC